MRHGKTARGSGTASARYIRAGFMALGCVSALVCATAWAGLEVRVTPRMPALQRFAAKEVTRYLYLRTGTLPSQFRQAGVVVIARQDTAAASDATIRAAANELQPQQFLLKTTTEGPRKTWWIVGGDDLGALYGAYRFCERLGVRFYLHGDAVPDERITLIPDMDEVGRPLFGIRGVNPWGAHPFGVDSWGTEGCKAVLTQLAKMRMNFFGVHCYPEKLPYAEPTVWTGLREDFDSQGRVRFSFPSRFYNTLSGSPWGGFAPRKTSDFALGGSRLFADDAWAPEVPGDHCPWPKSPEACNEVFNRMAAQWRGAFGFARRLGVKTCLGTETPLIIPQVLRERLKKQGKDPASPAVVREIYEGIFRRIAAAHPLDYYWLWTPEGWTWGGNKREQYAETVADVRLAIEALKNSAAPFQLAACGWVLGPQHDRAAFDNDLPKNIPMSAISRQLGWDAVDPAYGRIEGREKWAIPWLESDGQHGLAAIQLFVGRMRRDAADARAYGCTGLVGLQWRTDILGPNVAALAQAAWDQTGWNPSPAKLPAERVPAITEGPIGGALANYPNQKIANTADVPLYQTCRYNMEGYNLKLPDGRYRVTLKFCEPYFNAAGQRIGDFTLQGKIVIENLDIFARVGKFAALDMAFDGIEVTQGWLRLGVPAKVSMPCISAIVCEGPVTRKINCGGPAYKDYEPDLCHAESDAKRHLPCKDFYADWAQANFGSSAAGEIARVFDAVDGRLPMSVANGCPSGSLAADATPWPAVAARYACVADLESLRPRVQGRGNLERFDWWLNTFRYHRSLHQVRCALGEFDRLFKAKKFDAALAKYKEVLSLYGDTYRLLLSTVNSPGGLAMVVNLENHAQFWPVVVGRPAKELEAALGRPLPEDAKPKKIYQGAPRLIVPIVRSVAEAGERLTVQVIVLDEQAPASIACLWRPLGRGTFQSQPVTHIARGVHRVELPPATEDFEYRLEATTAGGQSLTWPVTAPSQNQTVVVLPRDNPTSVQPAP